MLEKIPKLNLHNIPLSLHTDQCTRDVRKSEIPHRLRDAFEIPIAETSYRKKIKNAYNVQYSVKTYLERKWKNKYVRENALIMRNSCAFTWFFYVRFKYKSE